MSRAWKRPVGFAFKRAYGLMERGAEWTTHRPVAEDGVHTGGRKTSALRPACQLGPGR